MIQIPFGFLHNMHNNVIQIDQNPEAGLITFHAQKFKLALLAQFQKTVRQTARMAQ